MLPSQQRLSRIEFDTLLASPDLQVVFCRFGTFKYRKAEKTLISVVTGAKQQKKAVRRNALRRKLYTVFCGYPVQGIFYASKQAYDASFEELQLHIQIMMQKALQ